MSVPLNGSTASEAEAGEDAASASEPFPDAIFDAYRSLPFSLRAKFPWLTHAAEDIAAEALLRTYQAWLRKGEIPSPTAYLAVVAKNLAVDTLRKTTEAPTEDWALAKIIEHAGASQRIDLSTESEAMDAVLTSLASMPMGRRRQVLQLQLQGQADDEIAAALSISPNQVRVQRHKAVAELRNKLRDRIRQHPDRK
ncbi:RNA polymerase sigma factor [Streptomyces virginiae]|uniref:RNA polymerase sigma factor n=1 Tax=Streptomyces virginiae TaxID=1961 RepID=UPI00344C81AC